MTHPKARLVALWSEELSTRLATLESSQSAARAGTRVDGSHRPENRGERAAVTSQGYLAHGLQQRIEAVVEHLHLLDEMGPGPRSEVVVGAWIELLLLTGQRRQIAVFPGGDAHILQMDEFHIQVLSPSSPLLQPLMGLEQGDGAELRGLGEVEITRIR